MNILENMALTTGSRINKPFVYKTFFPLPFEKYVVFSSQNKIPSKDYLLFQDVLNQIFPRLEVQGIKILQVGQKDSITYNGTINLCGRLTAGQTAYLMEKSLLFLGVDGFEAQLAGSFNIPIVCLNSSTYSGNTGPYFGDKSKQTLFECYQRTGNKKPSFNVNEAPKCINLVKPEEISNAIFQLLGMDFRLPLETVFIGDRYSHFTVQETLVDEGRPMFAPDNLVEIRADSNFKDKDLARLLTHYKKAAIITDRTINLDILKPFKVNIQGLIYKIQKDNKNLEFLNAVRELGIKILLISELSQSDVDALKIFYYEYGAINKLKMYSDDIINELKKDVDKLYYRSSKITSSNGKVYYSKAAQEADIPLLNNFEYAKVLDTPAFWRDLDFYTIVRLKN